MLKNLLNGLDIPKGEILFLHVKLKGISSKLPYSDISKNIINLLNEYYEPKTILVPTFTYSFTKTGIFNKSNTPSEVGRFSEEIRISYSAEFRTSNPVFNLIDTNNFFKSWDIDHSSAFAKNSHLDLLSKEGYVILNINLPELINTHLHYLEYKNRVPYRFVKFFQGDIVHEDNSVEKISYHYYVRDLDIDTAWRREKIKDFLIKNKILKEKFFKNIGVNWMNTKELDKYIDCELNENKQFLIEN
jgi:aminoglycoside 3-N-acetyltransferase